MNFLFFLDTWFIITVGSSVIIQIIIGLRKQIRDLSANFRIRAFEYLAIGLDI